MARKQRTSKETKELFRDPSGQTDLFEKSYQEELETKAKKAVECLGMTFQNDEARRAYFLEKLKEKLKDPEFRKIEGFPIGLDEDILALSDPPYYTACPNPFMEEFIKHYGKPYDPNNDTYRREPFAADVSEGKNDPIYNVHSYHTKVPHKAIMRYILHYTEPSDLVFDGFTGTGMTGIAAHLCGDKSIVESLSLKARSDGVVLDENGKEFSKLGSRRAILEDISPSATFISYNYNTPIRLSNFKSSADDILKEFGEEYGWMYETFQKDRKTKGRINYVVFSDEYYCPICSKELLLWDIAYDKNTKMKIGKEFSCNKCGAELSKRKLERVWETIYDESLGKTIKIQKRTPVIINYKLNGQNYEKKPDEYDFELLAKIKKIKPAHWYPNNSIPPGDKTGDPLNVGITNVHHYFSKRALITISALWGKARGKSSWSGLLFCLQSVLISFTYLNRFFAASFSQVNRYLKGTIFVSPLVAEVSPWYALTGKMKRLSKVVNYTTKNIISTNSLTQSGIRNDSIDYIFTDPPFGSNIMYSELNFVWEAWLKVFTNKNKEAVENVTQKKGLMEYQELMYLCFKECYRILKPSRWMTVEFHNSRNSVWVAIQEALQKASFIIADVRTIDKEQDTMNQMTASGAVKKDLIISAYKASGDLEGHFKIEAGTESGVWNFVRSHLHKLPVFVSQGGKVEIVAERQSYLLFDRMVAFHVQRGVSVPLSAAEFYQGLAQRFPEREGMYFLSDQVAEYDKKRMTVKEMIQLELFVIDESSAIQWLRQQILKKPQTFQEIHPQFLKEISAWEKHEKPLELMELLEQNFLRYDGEGEVPSNIHSYFSSNFKELRNLAKDDPVLRAKAKDRWYVPDPNKTGDLEKLRERALLKEFDEYRESKQKQIKVFRLEAVRAGFKKAWQERDYKTIIEVARKIPETVLQEDPKLLMWYDQALTRIGGE